MNDRSRHDDMKDDVRAFHAAHPEIWQLFCRLTHERIGLGFKHYSPDAIFHRIRWDMKQPSYEKGKEFKLNDHHTQFYSRRFMRMFPEHEGFFRTRKRPSEDQPATGRDPLTPEDFPTWPRDGEKVAP